MYLKGTALKHDIMFLHWPNKFHFYCTRLCVFSTALHILTYMLNNAFFGTNHKYDI